MANEAQKIPKQFQHVKRYWDPNRKVHVAKIMPGEIYVTRHHELVSTLLGSCIAVCMRDRFNKIGGMNHFRLPTPQAGSTTKNDTNYGIYAMEMLINEILKLGGNRDHLEAEIFGGGNVISTLTSSDIGNKNLKFVTEFLQRENIPVRGQHTGNATALQVYYHPSTGNAFSVENNQSASLEIKRLEKEYLDRINKDQDDDGIIYF